MLQECQRSKSQLLTPRFGKDTFNGALQILKLLYAASKAGIWNYI